LALPTHRRAGLRVELLEERLAPALITVTGTGDTIATDGLATLREAITSINNQADVNGDVTLNRVGNYASLAGGTADIIHFNIPGVGVKTISATAAEPTIVRPFTIDGYTQVGASVNTLANADNAVILVELNGANAGAGVNGLTLGAGSGGSTIRGLVVNRFSGNGIVIQSDGNSIAGNFIGVNTTGTTRMPNGTFPSSGDGIRIQNASNNMIGATSPADRNIVSGNAIDGIHVLGTLSAPATGNVIRNNFVGVAADGKSSVGNRTEPAPAPGSPEGNNLFGIEISGGNNNTVGGTVAGARNVVGLNASGIEIDNGGQSNVIQGNFVGVGADGVTQVGNLLHGIDLRSSNGFSAPLGPAQANEPGVSNNRIGGTVAGAGNLVEFNGTGGIAIFGNPVSASGQPNIGNAIEGNSIFLNGRSFLTASSAPLPLLGIDLTNGFSFPRDDGFTANDSKGHGTANAPNSFQDFPVLSSVTEGNGMTHVIGTLTGGANTAFRIELFASDIDPLGLPAEGQQFLGFVSATTDSAGHAAFTANINFSVALGRVVTATATDSAGNTSEFSPGRVLAAVESLAVSGLPNGTALVFKPDAAGQYATSAAATLTPFGTIPTNVRTAAGDVNGDGTPDRILVTGPGTPIRVAVISGADNSTVLVAPVDPFGGNFTGGGFVAAADLDGGGKAEFVVTPDRGGGPRVTIFSLINGSPTIRANFFGIDDPNFRGGARAALGDVNKDGTPDLAVSAGFLGGPRTALFNGTTLFTTPTRLIGDFFAFPGSDAITLRNGVFVAAGDVNGDGFADLIFGGGPGGAPRVFILSGARIAANDVAGAQATPIANFFVAGNASDRGGARVAAKDADSDAKADVVIGSGEGAPSRVRVYLGANFLSSGEPATFQDLEPFGGATLAGGVFVG
jgi:hypothetical protein